MYLRNQRIEIYFKTHLEYSNTPSFSFCLFSLSEFFFFESPALHTPRFDSVLCKSSAPINLKKRIWKNKNINKTSITNKEWTIAVSPLLFFDYFDPLVLLDTLTLQRRPEGSPVKTRNAAIDVSISDDWNRINNTSSKRERERAIGIVLLYEGDNSRGKSFVCWPTWVHSTHRCCVLLHQWWRIPVLCDYIVRWTTCAFGHNAAA